jgi:hypothetical protein
MNTFYEELVAVVEEPTVNVGVPDVPVGEQLHVPHQAKTREPVPKPAGDSARMDVVPEKAEVPARQEKGTSIDSAQEEQQ